MDPADSSALRAAAQPATRGASALRRLLLHFGLTDLWTHTQTIPPASPTLPTAPTATTSGQRFTHWSSSGTARRLDRVYVSSALRAGPAAAWHLPLGLFPGDHCAVAAEVGRGVLAVKVAPALERAARQGGDKHHLGIEGDVAAGGLPLPHRLDLEDRLAAQHQTLEHPVDRAAVDQFGRALWGLAGGQQPGPADSMTFLSGGAGTALTL